MSTRLGHFHKIIVIIVVNLMIVVTLFYGFEYYLRRKDPFLNGLPFDTGYYNGNKVYYQRLVKDKPEWYTWGNLVEVNRFGFRERDFEVPKPLNTCRIMVLGDSLTFGTGLAPEERYTELLEKNLEQKFSDNEFEVLNFSVSGGPTVLERDIIREFKGIVDPDLIVIGFFMNDPLPLEHSGYASIESKRFYEKYGGALDSFSQTLAWIGLPITAKTIRAAFDGYLVNSKILPPGHTGIERTYDKNSEEWQAYVQALTDIKQMSDELNLPAPVFAVLNHQIYVDHPTSYQDFSESLPIYLRWFHQGEQAAAKVGFRTHNHEQELIEQLTPQELPVNELDSHPSAKVQQIYAQKLFKIIASDIQNGKLCNPSIRRQLMAATTDEAPLAPYRKMRVKLGEDIRFLGYMANTTNEANQSVLNLSFGWQALNRTETSYTIFIHALDENGQLVWQADTIPCRGKCPTNYWPSGMVVPQGSNTIYWPPGLSQFPNASAVSRGRWYNGKWESIESLVITPSSDFHDTYNLPLPTQIHSGTYKLVIGMYAVASNTRLPAYDEVSETWLLEAEIPLGIITIPLENNQIAKQTP